MSRKAKVQKKYEKEFADGQRCKEYDIETGNLTNAMLEGDALNKYCKLGTKEKKVMEQAFSVMNLTFKDITRI